MKRIYIPLLAVLTTLPATAQETKLNKEITIEREIHPTLRAVSRLNTSPTLLQPVTERPRLTFSDMTVAAEIPGMITSLEPAASSPAIPLSPYRGYAALGYFPSFNLGASAGYRFIDKAYSSLGAWMQYNGNSYKADGLFIGDDATLRRHTITAGADMTYIFRRAGRLDISAGFSYSSLNRPWLHSDSNLGVTQYDITADWSARNREMAYFISAAFSGFSYNDPDASISTISPSGNEIISAQTPTENRYSIKGGTAYFITSNSSLAGRVNVDFLHYSSFNSLSSVRNAFTGDASEIYSTDGKTYGLISLAPSYRYKDGIFRANIGLLLQFSTNSDKTLHIAPDVNLSARPLKYLSAYVKFGGGEHLNTYQSLFDFTPYGSSSLAYGNSHIPFTAEAGISVGPFSGFSAEISGGYAAANDWLMPTTYLNGDTDESPTYIYDTYDLRAWYASASLRYKYSDLLTLSASCTIAPGSERHALYLNRDRAKQIVSFKATVSPIKKLTVDASFSLRAGRSAMIINYGTTPWINDGENVIGKSSYNLGNDNSLDLGGAYCLMDNLTVFLRCENILNRQAMLLPGLPSQGFKGLVGAAYKF